MKLVLSSLLLTAAITLHAQTVTIGPQVWMTKNLDVITYKNGESIPQAKSEEEWKKAGESKQPAWCYYDNDSAIGVKYGKLYNWYAVIDARGLCPTGWHVPSFDEWTNLINTIGGKEAGYKMKSTSGWEFRNILSQEYVSGNGTDSTGFSGLPGGSRDGIRTMSFSTIGYFSFWWSSSESSSKYAYFLSLSNHNSKIQMKDEDKESGFSVRCLRD